MYQKTIGLIGVILLIIGVTGACTVSFLSDQAKVGVSVSAPVSHGLDWNYDGDYDQDILFLTNETQTFYVKTTNLAYVKHNIIIESYIHCIDDRMVKGHIKSMNCEVNRNGKWIPVIKPDICNYNFLWKPINKHTIKLGKDKWWPKTIGSGDVYITKVTIEFKKNAHEDYVVGSNLRLS